jgi:hypothetical protein
MSEEQVAVVEQDNGLGLSEFLKGSSSEPEAEITASQNEVKTEPAQETITEKPEEKAEEVKETEVKPEPEVKADINWEKRYTDTFRWANELSQQNAELKRMIDQQRYQTEIINKKLDGTYDPEKDAPESQLPPPEVIAQTSETVGKIKSSGMAAEKIYGQEQVEKMLYAPDAPFHEIENNPIIRQRVLSADAPVIAAMQCVEEHLFYKKWGYTPTDIEKNMRSSLEQEIREKVTKEFTDKIQNKDKLPTGIGNARGVQQGAINQAGDGYVPLSQIFGR